MRELKFRAWDKTGKVMHQHDYCHIGRGFGTLLFGFEPRLKDRGVGENMKHYDFMQYTGLKDKNGTEIYEGDIVRGNDTLFTAKYDVAEVYYNTQHTQFRAKVDHNSFLLRDYLGETVEVIGNVHENPDLLEIAKEGI